MACRGYAAAGGEAGKKLMEEAQQLEQNASGCGKVLEGRVLLHSTQESLSRLMSRSLQVLLSYYLNSLKGVI